MNGEQASAGKRRRSSAVRLGAFYGTLFGALGIHMPFWPVWLEEARGMGATEVGLLLAAIYWPRVVASVVLGQLADRSGTRKRLLVTLAITGLTTTALFGVADGFWPLLVLSLVSGTALSGILPLGEATALEESARTGFDYARVRLVGSLTFMLAAAGGGLAVERYGAALVLPLLLGAMLSLVLACLAMPVSERPAAPRPGLGVAEVIRIEGLWPVLIAAALIQVSHAVYYGFATIHWRAAGLGGEVIGWLWAEAVVAEIVLFALAGRLLGQATPGGLLVVAGLLGTLRWSVTAASADLAVLLIVQTLHAATFALTHLATMQHLQHRAGHRQASAQGLYASLLAALYGLMTPLAGWLYERLAGEAFLVMAGLSLAASLLLGGAVVTQRARRWS